MEELGGGIRGRAAKGVEFVTRREFIAKAKVGDFDVHLGVKQQILGFEIPMYDFLLVTVLHRRDDLPKLGSRLFFFHPAVQNQIIEYLATARVLHHQVQGFFRLDHLEELDDVRMVQHLHYPDLAEELQM